MRPSTKAALAIGGAVLGVGALAMIAMSGDEEEEGEGQGREPGGGWSDRSAPDRIREIAGPIEETTGWHGLTDFLIAVAWGESRGNQYACAGVSRATLDDACSGNKARGWFQNRPSSAYADEYAFLVDDDPDLIRRDARYAVAFFVWYVYRLRNYAKKGQTVDWLAIRRGGALPRLVKDVDEEAVVDRIKPGTDPPRKYKPGERSADVRERFEQAVAAVGLPDDFMYERAFPPGFVWPTFEQILSLAGIEERLT